MPVIIQSQFTSTVVEANADVFTRSYTEGENTIIEFDTTRSGSLRRSARCHCISMSVKVLCVWPAFWQSSAESA